MKEEGEERKILTTQSVALKQHSGLQDQGLQALTLDKLLWAMDIISDLYDSQPALTAICSVSITSSISFNLSTRFSKRTFSY